MGEGEKLGLQCECNLQVVFAGLILWTVRALGSSAFLSVFVDFIFVCLEFMAQDDISGIINVRI